MQRQRRRAGGVRADVIALHPVVRRRVPDDDVAGPNAPRDDVARTSGRSTDEIVVGTDQIHAVLVGADDGRSGGVRANPVALDRVAVRATLQADVDRRRRSDDVALTRSRSADQIRLTAEHADAERAV